MNLFKPEDLIKDDFDDIHAEIAADLANEIFNKWLESQPTVLCERRRYPDKDGFYFVCSNNNESVPWAKSSHSAKLVCVEVIE